MPNDAPDSVANFLGYVDRGDYIDTIFHRSVRQDSDGDGVADFSVIQGGGFNDDLSTIATQPPVENEFMNSNVRGTLAYARTTDPDSATSQFFFNVTDNVPLDIQLFTVFGEVTSGLDVVDAINDLQIVNASGGNQDSPFGELPVLDSFDGQTVIVPDDLVILNSVTVAVPEPSSMLIISAGAMLLMTKRRRV